MKALINGKFVAVRTGEFVEAGEGEFILDTRAEGEARLKKAVLIETAKANKIKVSDKLTVDELYELLEAELSALKLPEQNTPTESQQVEEICRQGFEAGVSEDDILIKIVTSGVGFKKAGKLYKQAVEKLGLKVNTKDLASGAGDILTQMEFNPKTVEEMDAAAKAIVAEYPKAEAGQVRSVIRRYLRANKIEIPKAPVGQRGAIGFRKTAFDWMLANTGATVAEFKAWATKEKDEKVAEKYAVFFEFAQKFAEAASAE